MIVRYVLEFREERRRKTDFHGLESECKIWLAELMRNSEEDDWVFASHIFQCFSLFILCHV